MSDDIKCPGCGSSNIRLSPLPQSLTAYACNDCNKRFNLSIQDAETAERAVVAARPAFEGKTCGECAWGVPYRNKTLKEICICRRVAFGYEDMGDVRADWSACPAFVAKTVAQDKEGDES